MLLTDTNYYVIAIHNGVASIKGQNVFTAVWKSKRKMHTALRSGMIFSLILAPISFFYLSRGSVSADQTLLTSGGKKNVVQLGINFSVYFSDTL